MYTVIKVIKGGKVTMRLGTDGKGRLSYREWDAVGNWLFTDIVDFSGFEPPNLKRTNGNH